jgi:hypothetical protein
MVRFANICSDLGHSASTNGVGAVMGSKRLKAVVVNGQAPVPVHDRKRLRDLAKQWSEQAQASAMGFTVHTVGTAGLHRRGAHRLAADQEHDHQPVRAPRQVQRRRAQATSSSPATPATAARCTTATTSRSRGRFRAWWPTSLSTGHGRVWRADRQRGSVRRDRLNDVADRLGMDKECSSPWRWRLTASKTGC